MFCNQCGHHNPDGSRFCSSCGAPLERPAGDETSVLEAVTADPGRTATSVAVIDENDDRPDGSGEPHATDLTRGQALLVVKRGPNAGSRFVLEGAVVRAGRSPESEIFLDDITVSRHHAEFLPRPSGGYDVRDNASTNGTYVNRERINAPSALANGDEVQIGKFKLVYMTGVSA